MRYLRKTSRFIVTAMVLCANFLASACTTMTSPVDQAYYTSGDLFSLKGGYTRTIFSPSNF